jgi:hypothetical protein
MSYIQHYNVIQNGFTAPKTSCGALVSPIPYTQTSANSDLFHVYVFFPFPEYHKIEVISFQVCFVYSVICTYNFPMAYLDLTANLFLSLNIIPLYG